MCLTLSSNDAPGVSRICYVKLFILMVHVADIGRASLGIEFLFIFFLQEHMVHVEEGLTKPFAHYDVITCDFFCFLWFWGIFKNLSIIFLSKLSYICTSVSIKDGK